MAERPIYKLRHTSPNVWGLFSGEEETGTLVFRNPHGSLAEAKTGKESLLLARSASFRKDLTVRRNDAPAGEFVSDLLSRGALTLGNHTYRWRPHNVSWTTWGFETTHGFPVVKIRLAGVSRREGIAAVVGNLEEKEGRILSLVGWHLLLLNHQDFHAQLRHVANQFLGRRTAEA